MLFGVAIANFADHHPPTQLAKSRKKRDWETLFIGGSSPCPTMAACNYHWCDVLTDHRHFTAMIGDKAGEISTYKSLSLGCLIVQRPHMSRQRLIKVQEKILWHQ